jgi:hypothetical protein
VRAGSAEFGWEARLREVSKAMAEDAATDTHSDGPVAGQPVVGDCELLERIGGASTAEVYKARQRSLNRTVAVKLLPADAVQDPQALERFRAEAEILASAHHPNLVDVHWVGRDGGRVFLAMEYVAGETLAARLEREERLPPDEALAVMRQVAGALAAVHDAGIIHCNIQPANILVTAEGDARLIGFHFARRGEAGAKRTPPALLEKLLYYPPEATRGKRLDQRSDLYLLGATFYHAIAGRPPFEGKTAEERALQYARNEPEALNRLVPTAPMALCMVIHKLLRREPGERYASAAEAVEALGRADAVLGKREGDTSRMVRSGTRSRRRESTPAAEGGEPKRRTERQEARRKPVRWGIIAPVAGGAVALLAVVLLLVLGGSEGDQTPRPAAKAPAEPARTETPRPRPAPVPTVPPPEPVAKDAEQKTVRLEAAEADIRSSRSTGPTAKYEEDKNCIGFWESPEDWARWEFDAVEAKTFRVQVVYAAEGGAAGNGYTVSIGTQLIPCKVAGTGSWDTFKTEAIGTLSVSRPGTYPLAVRPQQVKPGTALMNLRAVILTPTEKEETDAF